jgi:hypothetical protein
MDVSEARLIARDAYVFGFSFVANYRVFIERVVRGDPTMLGKGFNEFACYRDLVPVDTPDTPQHDTLYVFAVIDLRREPMVIAVPDVSDGYSYMLQLGDTSTETLPYISTITTGNRAGRFALIGPDYQGYLPSEQFDGVITTRGQFVVVIGRVSILDPNNLERLHGIQNGIVLSPLSEILGTDRPTDPGPIDFIQYDDEQASGLGVFGYINQALAWHPPALSEVADMARFSRIGVIPGEPFATDGLRSEIVAALEAGIADAKTEIEDNVEKFTPMVNGWNWATMDVSRFGTDYLNRSTVALKNIYPNAPDHAVYGQAFRDSAGNELHGKNSYTVTFPPNQTPPVNWFWSLTLYNAETTSMYPNPTGRTNLGDRTAGLRTTEDGSLTLTVQHQPPPDTSNWLPAPDTHFYLVLRCYGPKEEVRSGNWTPPEIIRTE